MDIKFLLLRQLAKCFGFNVVEERGRVKRFNSVLSIYVYCEDNAKHNSPHAHITLNNRKIGEIDLTTWTIDDRDNILNRKTLKEVNEWIATNKKEIVDEWNKCNKKIKIDFLCY